MRLVINHLKYYFYLYRVPFTQALQLVGRRAVYLEKGYAYVPLQSLVSIIVSRVSSHEFSPCFRAQYLFLAR